MKSIVNAFASVARRVPWVVVVVALVLTAIFGSLARNVVVATGNEGFAPDSPEIVASEQISELFGDATAETPLQVIIRDDGGDVITAEGLHTTMAAVETIQASEVGGLIADRPERPGVFHYLSAVEQAAVAQGIDLETITDEQVKALYTEAIDNDGEFDAPPEQASFLRQLVSQDFDSGQASAESGMILVFLTPPPGDTEESFNAQVAAEESRPSPPHDSRDPPVLFLAPVDRDQ